MQGMCIYSNLVSLIPEPAFQQETQAILCLKLKKHESGKLILQFCTWSHRDPESLKEFAGGWLVWCWDVLCALQLGLRCSLRNMS